MTGRVQRPKDRLICRCPRRLHSTPRLAAAIAHVSLSSILPCLSSRLSSSLLAPLLPEPRSGVLSVARPLAAASGASSSSPVSRRLSLPTSFREEARGLRPRNHAHAVQIAIQVRPCVPVFPPGRSAGRQSPPPQGGPRSAQTRSHSVSLDPSPRPSSVQLTRCADATTAMSAVSSAAVTSPVSSVPVRRVTVNTPSPSSRRPSPRASMRTCSS